MPSTSPKQARFMQAVAHSPKFAKKVGVPQAVGEDFNAADEALPSTQRPEVTPRVRANKNAMAKLLTR